jgi:sulfur carrier protein ThiS
LNIEIRLFANLAQFLPPGAKNKRAKITVKDGISIAELLDELNIPKNTTSVIMVNGVHQKTDVVLNEGDVLSVIPPVTGG